MTTKTTNLITLGMLVGVLLGCLLGNLTPEFMIATGFLGRLFVNALMIIVIPMIFAGVVSGVSSLSEYRKIGRAGSRTAVYLVTSTAVAAVVGLVVAFIMSPGVGVNTGGLDTPALLQTPHARTVGDLVSTLLPDNLVRALTDGYYIGLVLLAVAIGMAVSRIGSRGRTIVYFCRELMESIGLIVHGLQYVAPIGLCSLVGTAVALNTMAMPNSARGVGWFIAAAIIAFLIHALVILPLFLKYWGKRKVLSFGSMMTPAFFTALGTGSSAAALPVTYDCAVGRNHVDNRTGSLVLPLGASAGMNGTALYVVLATVFVAQMFNLSFSFFQILLLGATAVVLSFGAAGVPSGGFYLLVAAFGVAGFPPSAYIGLSLLLAVDWIVDRFRAVINVWSDSVGAAVVAQSIGRGFQDAGAAGVSNRPDRDIRRGRPDQSGRREDRWRRGKPERSAGSTAPSPFVVTSAAEADLEATSSETRPAAAEADSERPGRSSRSDSSDRGGRGRPRYQDRRDQEGREQPRGGRGRHSEERSRREGGPRFGDRGRDHEGDRPRHRGSRDDRKFRGRESTPTEQPKLSPVETETELGLHPQLTPESSAPARNQELFSVDDGRSTETESNELFADAGSSAGRTESEDHEQDADAGTPPMDYGRSKFRRAEKPESEGDLPDSEQDSASETAGGKSAAEEQADSEPLAFGRTPRKRLRQ